MTSTRVHDPINGDAWMDDANCAGVDAELFFPDHGEPTDDAKAICAACTVRAECLEYALANSIRFGIWGGRSERERRAIRAARRRSVA